MMLVVVGSPWIHIVTAAVRGAMASGIVTALNMVPAAGAFVVSGRCSQAWEQQYRERGEQSNPELHISTPHLIFYHSLAVSRSSRTCRSCFLFAYVSAVFCAPVVALALVMPDHCRDVQPHDSVRRTVLLSLCLGFELLHGKDG